ncbi:hypothetical protein B4U80_10384, partial [Leptotrombidium deliense]
ILCLHGYRQDSNLFREKSGGLRKLLKNVVDFVFVDAPHLVPLGEQNPDADSQFRSWWFSERSESNVNSFYSGKHSDICIGFDESLKVIDEACAMQGPFDGILGFSQGAAMVALICTMIRDGTFRHSFKFAVFFAAFESLNSHHESLYSKKINIPSLHVIGETDKVIVKERSVKLSECFECPSLLFHKGGHCVPSSSQNKTTFLEFFDKFRDVSNGTD